MSSTEKINLADLDLFEKGAPWDAFKTCLLYTSDAADE